MQSIKAFIHDHPHMWWGLFLPVYLALFFTIEHFITDNYWATQLPIDYKIPFLEGFAPFYASWSVLLCILGIYLIIKDGEGFRRYMWSIMVTFLISTLICALIPNGQDLRPAVMPRDNIFCDLVAYTYSLDTNTNVFPSVHVLGVIAAVSAVWHTPGLRKWGWRAGSLALGIVIIAATLFVKQHAFIDVLAGLFVGALGDIIVYVVIGKKRDRLMAEGKRLRYGSCQNADS